MSCEGDIKPETILAVAEALRRHTKRVRRPSTITNTELVRLYGTELGFNRRQTSCLGRNTIARLDLYKALGGHAKWGSAPTYTRGLWCL